VREVLRQQMEEREARRELDEVSAFTPSGWFTLLAAQPGGLTEGREAPLWS
jgi:hypothetical protein